MVEETQIVNAEDIQNEESGNEPFSYDAMDDLMRDYDENQIALKPGQIVTGTIVQISNEDVIVDIGAKSEAVVSFQEFEADSSKEDLFVGKEVKVYLQRLENKLGQPVVSRTRAIESEGLEKLQNAHREGQPVPAKIIGTTKGGFRVEVCGKEGFIPMSQSGIRRGKDENVDQHIGKILDSLIIELKRDNLVLSPRAYRDRQQKLLREGALSSIKEGDKITGSVTSVMNYGAFIDLGGVDGLLHVQDMAWNHVKNPASMVSEGDEIEVLILKVDNDRIGLGLKQLTSDPWLEVPTTYPSGSRITGTVTSLTNYGAFVELTPGVEGLVHVSELSWVKRINHPKDVLQKGEKIEVQVLDFDLEKRKLSLSYRQTCANPWDEVEDTYPKGSTIEGKVVRITDFGAFVELESGIDGLIRSEDFSWDHARVKAEDYVKVGDLAKVVVLEVSSDKKRIGLGFKQITEDPFLTVARKYPAGSKVKATITRVTDFGAFAEIEPGVEGLIHISELSERRIEKTEEAVKVGDEVEMKVLKIDKKTHKISLSVKKLLADEEREEIAKYTSDDDTGMTSLGDLLREALKEHMP